MKALLIFLASLEFLEGLRNPLRVLTSNSARIYRNLHMEFDWTTFKKKSEESYKKSADALSSQFNTLRAGGANVNILDRVFVDNFGSITPLNQVARISTAGSQQLVIEPFDKSITKEIEKAISSSSLNLTPTNDGSGVIRINVRLVLPFFLSPSCRSHPWLKIAERNLLNRQRQCVKTAKFLCAIIEGISLKKWKRQKKIKRLIKIQVNFIRYEIY